MHDLGNPWTRSWAMTMMLWISYCCSRTYQPNSVKTWRMVIFYIVLHWICCTHWILSRSILSGKNGAIEAQHSPAHIQLLPTSFNFTILLSHSHFRSVQVCSGCQGWLRSTIADEVGGGTPGAVSSLKVWEMAKGRKYSLDVQLMLGSKRIEHVSELSLLQLNKHRKTCFFPKHVSRNTTIGPRCPVEGGLFILTRSAMECFPRTNWQYKLGQRSNATILWWGHPHSIPPRSRGMEAKKENQCKTMRQKHATTIKQFGWGMAEIQFLVPSGYFTSPWNTIFKNGKPSISMGHFPWLCSS